MAACTFWFVKMSGGTSSLNLALQILYMLPGQLLVE
jgi:hypothetical protein